MKNRTKELLGNGKTAFGVQLRLGSPAIAEIYALAGFDFVMFDGEHAPQTPAGMQAQIQAISSTDATPIVRLSNGSPDQIQVYTDMGALGVFSPFVCTAEQARIAGDALLYPPAGTRGFGPSRAAGYGSDADYFKQANDQMLYIANIEHGDAIKNIDEILAVESLDTFIIGPCDLSISLGVPMDFEHPKMKDAIQTVLKAAEKAGKPAGTAVYGGDIFEEDTYKRFIDMGFQLILVAGDEWMLNSSCSKVMESISSLQG